jgi:hypothetical protein
MKRLLLTLLVVFVCGSSQAHAAGFGLYGSLGGGRADWTVDETSLTTLDFGKDTGHVSVGLAMDTAPASNKLFNYQLNLGYDRFRNTGGGAWGPADFEGLVVSNNFGFGSMISPTTRFWFGPEIRVTWLDGHPEHFKNYKVNLFGVGIGPVIGMNLNYDDTHTLVLKMGYQYINYVGEGNGRFNHTTNAADTISRNYDYDVTEKMLYVTVGFLFRTSSDR